MTRKKEKEKIALTKNDFDFGVYNFEDLYTLSTLTAYFMKKYKINDLVAFYKKVYPDSSFIHIVNYEKINLLNTNNEFLYILYRLKYTLRFYLQYLYLSP